MKKFKSLFLALTLGAALLLSACGGGASSSAPASEPASEPESAASEAANTDAQFDDVTIKVGATPTPHAEILEVVKPILAEQGITLEIVEFTDYILPNTGTDDGSLDANYFQHDPYLEQFNEENETDLVSIAYIHIEPLGVYPGQEDSLDALEKGGATVAIPSDPTNEARALFLLESLGYITLAEDAGFEVLPSDIVENPYDLEFVELEASQIPARLGDVDFGIINGNYALGADVADTVLATEGAESPYVNVLVVKAGDETRPELIALADALQSEEVRKFIQDSYDGLVVPVF